jgi:parallel beta helix pectate lyase-like protein
LVKVLNNTSPGTSGSIGGDDWDEVASYINSQSVYSDYSYLVYKDGSNYKAKNGITGEIDYSNSAFTTVIQGAIDTTDAAGGGVIFIKSGTYIVNSAINIVVNNIILQGEGKDSTILICGTSTVNMIIKNDNTATSNFAIRDMTINGNDISGQLLNLVDNITGVLLENVKFTKGNSSGPQVVGGDSIENVIIKNCDFTDANAGGDLIGLACNNLLVEGCFFSRTVSGGGLTFGLGKDLKIINNHWEDYTGYGAISLENLSGDFENVLIEGNTFRNVSEGNSINTASGGGSSNTFQNVEIANNILIDSGGILIGLYFSDLSIHDNVLLRSCSDGAAGIYVQAPQRCIIANNILYDKLAGTSPFAGIMIDTDSTVGTNISIIGNKINTYEKHGIHVSDVKQLEIIDNTIRNVGGLTDNSYRGIFLFSNGDVNSVGIVSNNLITSSLANKPYACIELDSSAATTNITCRNNYLSDFSGVAIECDLTATGIIVKNNTGFKTENSGTGTVANGTTSIAVNHGLAITPSINNIVVTPTNSMGSATKYYISTVTSTQFTINVDVNPGATTATFSWSIV